MQRLFKSRDDLLFDICTTLLLVSVLLIIFIPLWYVLVVSLMPLDLWSSRGGTLWLWPNEWSFEAYKQLLSQPSFARATINSLSITFAGVLLNLVLTVLTAYALTRKTLPGRNLFIMGMLFAFLFNAGIIPTYLLVQQLGLLNTLPSVILPNAISVYNTFVMMAFFRSLPEGLEEAARLDGANDFQVLRHVVLPLSKPILLTIGLFYGVAHWNEFFQPLLYLTDDRLMPLPVLLRNILTAATMAEYVESSNFMTRTSQQSLKMAAVVLTTLPMLLVYPWIQRYFTKGVLIGGVKE
jgi:putative aldouronate transport system permease protein